MGSLALSESNSKDCLSLNVGLGTHKYPVKIEGRIGIDYSQVAGTQINCMGPRIVCLRGCLE